MRDNGSLAPLHAESHWPRVGLAGLSSSLLHPSTRLLCTIRIVRVKYYWVLLSHPKRIHQVLTHRQRDGYIWQTLNWQFPRQRCFSCTRTLSRRRTIATMAFIPAPFSRVLQRSKRSTTNQISPTLQYTMASSKNPFTLDRGTNSNV